jgi:hypothetical protein
MVSEEMQVFKNKSDSSRYELLAKDQKEVKHQNHAKNTHWSLVSVVIVRARNRIRNGS